MKGTIHIISGDTEKRVIPLEAGRYTIGRGEEAAIQIASQQVSRRHAEIVVDEEGISVLDCGSANGTAVNGKFITAKALRDGDQIAIGEVVLEYREENGGGKRKRRTEEPFAPRPSVYAAATKVISDKLRPRALWPMFTLIFAAAFSALAVGAGLSYRSLLKERLADEAMQRAQGLVRLLAEKNREDLKLNNELLLDVDGVLKERGVREAMIINAKGRILAPISRLNQAANDPFTTEALAQNSDRPILPSPRAADGTHILVHPIRAYSDKAGKYETLGAAKIIFAPADAVGALDETNRLLHLMLIAALLLAVFLGWASSKALATPMSRLTERIHRWRSGQVFQKEPPPYKDWAPLYDAVDRALDENNENESK